PGGRWDRDEDALLGVAARQHITEASSGGDADSQLCGTLQLRLRLRRARGGLRRRTALRRLRLDHDARTDRQNDCTQSQRLHLRSIAFRHRIVVGSPLLWYTARCGPFAPPGVRRSGGNSMLRIAWLTLACVIGLGATSTIAAQVQTGSILVRVSDEQGAAGPGVTITLTSTA